MDYFFSFGIPFHKLYESHTLLSLLPLPPPKSQNIVAWLISSNWNNTDFGNILEHKILAKHEWREDVGARIIKYEKFSFLAGISVFSTRGKILPEASPLTAS